MDNNSIKFVGDLVESLGSQSFDGCFFRFYDEVIGIAQCTVFDFPKNGEVRIILAVGKNISFDKSAKSLAYDYVNGFYRGDPYLNELTDEEFNEHPAWNKVEPSAIEDSQYRTKFYDQPNLAHELVLLFKDKRHSLTASLYRSSSQGDFTVEEEVRAGFYIDLSLRLLNKHIGMLQPIFDNTKAASDSRHHQVLEILARCNLSPREAEVCAMILLGYTTIGIGLNLNISTNTVATHRKRAYAKLGIASQNELFCRCFDVLSENRPNSRPA